jgi:hypothetical protein
MDLVTALVLGALAGAAMFAALSGARWHLRRSYNFARWGEDIERDAFDLIHAHLLVAECRLRLAQRIEKLPDDFEHPVFQAAQIGVAIERAVLAEAEKRGLMPSAAKPAVVKEAPAKVESDRSAPFTFVGGHLVPRRAS